jgi:branched-chain amino acid transport system ATP-binding protein
MIATPLVCRQVSVKFGVFTALNDVNLEFAAGQVTALIGPNGAGKTTLMNVLSGLQPPTLGVVHLNGVDVTRAPPHVRAVKGMARSFQIVNVFPTMTVFENVLLAAQRTLLPRTPWWRTVDSLPRLADTVRRHLDDFGLTLRAHEPAGELSHGEQRALELALSLMGSPSVLLLDEPLAGVGHADLPSFIALLRRVATGRTVVLVEHNMDAVMGLADRIVCLVAGAVLASGPPEEIRSDKRVRSAYLGS